MDYEYLIERYDRKTVSVMVHPQKGVIVKAPVHLSQERIELFLLKHDDWIKQKINKNEQEKHYFDDVLKGQKALYLGKKMQIVRVDDATKVTDRWIAIKNGQDIQRNVKKLLKAEAARLIPLITADFAQKMGVSYHSVEVKEYKSRNGACTSEGDLTFSWRLIMVDKALIDYVVVHELAHLKQFNHSKDFWLEVEKWIPDYKQRKKALDLYRFKDQLYR